MFWLFCTVILVVYSFWKTVVDLIGYTVLKKSMDLTVSISVNCFFSALFIVQLIHILNK